MQLGDYLFLAYLIIKVVSTGAGEYTNCTSPEGVSPPSTSILDMILNNLMVRFQ